MDTFFFFLIVEEGKLQNVLSWKEEGVRAKIVGYNAHKMDKQLLRTYASFLGRLP